MKTRRINRISVLVAVACCLAVISGPVFGRPPRVVEAVPDNGEVNIDPQLQQIRIVFDQDMSQRGYSVCGGGPKFPSLVGKPGWLNRRTFIMKVRLQADHEYEFSINCSSATNFKNIGGESAEIYPIRFKTGPGSRTGQGRAGSQAETASDINRKIARLNVGQSTLHDVIRLFGEPMNYFWGNKTFTRENLPATYLAMYSNGFSVLISGGHITEFRHEGPDGYLFLGKLQVSASTQEAVRLVGRPRQIVKGKPNKHEDGVFYRDIDGQKGRCYYGRKDKGVRFFFKDNKISAMYVTRDDRSGLPEAFTVAFKPIGFFKPKTRKELLDAFNENQPRGVQTHHFRTEVKDGTLVGYIQVDGPKGKEAVEKMINESPKLTLIIEEPTADDETKINTAVESAEAWLKATDMGDYAGSWEQACGLFKGMVSKEQLVQSLGMVRRPLGKMISRQVMSTKHTEIMPGMGPGEYVVVQFETSFENKKNSIETVTPMLDEDGIWRVSGYYIK
jgi:hypothetical protein